MSDPMEAIKELKNRLNGVTTQMGMEVLQLSMAPGDGMHTPDTIQVVFLVDANVAFKTPEELETERKFREMQLQDRAATELDRVKNAREALIQRMRDTGQILPEDLHPSNLSKESVVEEVAPAEPTGDDIFELPIEEVERLLRNLDNGGQDGKGI